MVIVVELDEIAGIQGLEASRRRQASARENLAGECIEGEVRFRFAGRSGIARIHESLGRPMLALALVAEWTCENPVCPLVHAFGMASLGPELIDVAFANFLAISADV